MFMVELTIDSHYSLLGVRPDADAAQVRAARDRIVEDLRIRQWREPANREAYLAEQARINHAADELVRPARRAGYDKAHPHLRFFTVRGTVAPVFASAPALVVALRTAVADHLGAAGIPAGPASELDRRDFTADFTHDPLLDGGDP